MIISHKYKFIFIKTKKTAGTSIEIALSRYCDNNDILTEISPADEKIRSEFGKKAQNYEREFFNHISAKRIKNKVDNEIWNSYYKFCFDRNPWDKVISFYYYVCNPDKITFDDFLKTETFKHAYNYPKYTINDEIVVDFIGKYENLEKDMGKISREIGLPYDGWLPNSKGNFRKDRRHYRNIYTNEQKELIRQYYKKEIDLLEYEY